MALIDSTCSKDSNDILFVICGLINQKIWFSEDLDEFWFKFLFESCFKSGTATCLLLIGAYRFGQIRSVDRRIWSDMDGSDRTVPFRFKWSVWFTGSRSNSYDLKEGSSPVWARVPARKVWRGGSGSTPATLQWLLDDGDATTASRRRWCHDKMQEDEADSGAWSSSSIASREREGGRLEAARVHVHFGRQGCARSATSLGEQRAWEGAPCRGEADREEEEDGGSPAVANFAGRARRCQGCRREVPPCLVDVFGREQRRSREVFWGYL
jgi:hypothetical protein